MNFQDILKKIELFDAQLVAVTKHRTTVEIQNIINFGQWQCGENRVVELLEKKEKLSDQVKWHMIGHLQTNKVKDIIGKVELIQSIDSQKLFEKVSDESQKVKVISPILFQIHVAQEETKFGFSADDFFHFLDEALLQPKEHISMRGIMGIASNTNDFKRVEKDFKNIRSIFEKAKSYFTPADGFNICSMGMSSDYQIALNCGSNMVRLGSILFEDKSF